MADGMIRDVKRAIGTVALAATVLCSSPLPSSAAIASTGSPDQAVPPHRPGEIVVLTKGSEVPSKIRFATDAEAEEAIAAYRRDPDVVSVGWNVTFEATADRVNPDDEYFSNQWYLEKINAPEAWTMSEGSKSVVVAVLDTGVDLDHPDLRNNIWTNPYEVLDGLDNDHNGFPDDIHGWDFVNDVGDPRPRFTGAWTETGVNHGTIVSGIIGAVGNNRIGIAGVTWNVRIMPVKVLDDQGLGDVETVAKGIDYAVRNGAQVMNLSFVGLDKSSVLDAAIARAAGAGVTVVTAAGNDNAQNGGHDLDQSPNYPVCSDGGAGKNFVIGVAATDEKDVKAPFSGYGSHCVDISAPGVGFYSTRYQDVTIPNFGEPYGGFWQGTSLATAVVSGAAALLKAVSPSLSPDEIRDFLESTAVPIDGLNPTYAGKLGAGRLDIAAAVAKVIATRTQVRENRAYVGTAAPAGLPPEVKLFTPSGAYVRSFMAYGPSMTSGVSAASGDVDGDWQDEIVTAPAGAASGTIRVWSSSGAMKGEFYGFADRSPTGVSLAVGDLTGSGPAEIVAAERSGGSEVRVFSGTGQLLSSFSAYAPEYKGGVSVAVGDVDADGKDEIITAPLSGGGPHIRIFDLKGDLKAQFFAGDKSDTRGWRVAAGDTQHQGSAGIGVMPASGKADTLELYNGLGVLYGVVEFSASVERFPFAIGDVDGDGRSDVVITAPTPDGVSFAAHDTDGKSKGYAVVYMKPVAALPDPFVVLRP